MAITASVEAIQKASNDTQDAKQDIDALAQSLRAEMETMASAWKGQAATAFQGVMQSYDEEIRTLMEALQGIGEQLQASGATIAQNEEDQNAAFGKFAGI